jgi:tetratricopeptide (TPR) repeat protein
MLPWFRCLAVPVLALLALVACGGGSAASRPATQALAPQGSGSSGNICAATETPSAPTLALAAGPPWRVAEHNERPIAQVPTAAVITEIRQLEDLEKTADPGLPTRVDLLRKLAEGYVQLEAAASRDGVPLIVGRARANAEKYYSLIVRDYPDYPQLDEVLYYLAYEYEQESNNAKARLVYRDLTVKRPQSQYVPNAYVHFGNLFVNEAQADPSKWKIACYAYVKAVGYPPPSNTVYGQGWLRLAQILEHFQDRAHSRIAYQKVIDYAREFPRVSGSAELATQVPDWAR